MAIGDQYGGYGALADALGKSDLGLADKGLGIATGLGIGKGLTEISNPLGVAYSIGKNITNMTPQQQAACVFAWFCLICYEGDAVATPGGGYCVPSPCSYLTRVQRPSFPFSPPPSPSPPPARRRASSSRSITRPTPTPPCATPSRSTPATTSSRTPSSRRTTSTGSSSRGQSQTPTRSCCG